MHQAIENHSSKSRTAEQPASTAASPSGEGSAPPQSGLAILRNIGLFLIVPIAIVLLIRILAQ